MRMQFDSDNDLLIIPDVHGRGFWREAVASLRWSHVVFLGDYTDPYPHENISVRVAYDNFCDIIAFAEAHREQTTLLLGNHDMHYKSSIFDRLARGSRFSSEWAQDYKALFDAHDSLFSLAFEACFYGVRCLFTHAGVVPEWYHRHAQLIGDLNADNLNRLAASAEGMIALSEVGWERGGLDPQGGPLWADRHEVYALDGDIFQIFGHTQNMSRQPVVTPYYACLDTHDAYRLSEVIRMR